MEGCLIESNVYDGIYFDPMAPCPFTANNVIKHNQILAPNPFVFGGPQGRWAIEDLSGQPGGAPSNNYYDNQAFNYPGTSDAPGITNYDPGMRSAGGVNSSTNGFIATWSVPGAPPTPPSLIPGISNLDVTDAVCPFGDTLCQLTTGKDKKKVEEIREAVKNRTFER